MFKLVIEDDEGNKTVVPIIRDEITIGRREGNTIRLTERNVSRDHAKLIRRNGDVFIKELSARYGTRRNGDRIDGEEEFVLGDIIAIGDYRLTLQSDVVAEPKPPAIPNTTPSSAPPPPEARPKRRMHEGTEIIDTDPARLVIVSSNFAGQEFPLARREMVIGRGEECDIIIDHRSVSQTHAKIVRESSGEYKIIDLKSKNGVKVSGEEYRAVHLKRGDIIDLGHVKFRFVESGENYVFTPHIDDEPAPAPANKGLFAVAFVALMVISAVIVWVLTKDSHESESIAIDTTLTASQETDTAQGAVANSLDEKIDRAEQDYLAAKVQKAVGVLELLREDDPTPSQVERIDDLLSKAKREIAFARFYENGRHHFEGGRWLDALQEFRQIPDDRELNVYRLVEDGRFVEDAVTNATADQLEVAHAATGAERTAAVDRLKELQAMFPAHVAPPEALAELADAPAEPTLLAAAAAKPVRTNKRNNARPKPRTPAATPVTQPTEVKVTPTKPSKPAGNAEELYGEAMAAMLGGEFNTAKSKGHQGLRAGCGAKCYRVIAMAHHKLGESAQACEWFVKAGVAIPSDLDCK